MKTFLQTACAAAALFILAVSSFAVLKPGDALMPFSLLDVDNREYAVTLEDGRLTLTVTETAGGEARTVKSHPDALLIDFWATWCVPCRKAMPHLQSLHEKYGPAEGQAEGGLRIIGIALDDAGSKVVRPFIRRIKVTYPNLVDPTKGDTAGGMIRSAKETQARYRVQEIPVVYLIDSGGNITHVHVGFKEEFVAELDHAVNGLMKGGKG
ncbi:MAG: TlpA family protein disulfide reductase [Candidatus Aminicenantes bacterium]|nr:TlpA family protein disulfide reductase [Candidatus Aminicenantes bacterium]